MVGLRYIHVANLYGSFRRCHMRLYLLSLLLSSFSNDADDLLYFTALLSLLYPATGVLIDLLLSYQL